MTAQVWMKAAGAVMVVTGASGFGFWLAGQYGQRLKELEQLRQMIFLLKAQILYANAPLSEAFETVGRRTEGALSGLFLRVAKRIDEQQGESFYQIWQEEIERLDKPGARGSGDAGRGRGNTGQERGDAGRGRGNAGQESGNAGQESGNARRERGDAGRGSRDAGQEIGDSGQNGDAGQGDREARGDEWEMKHGGSLALAKSDRQVLKSLGEHLGFLDRDMQERNLLLYLEQLDMRIGQMREHKQERCRLYTSLGIMGGLFLTILLI